MVYLLSHWAHPRSSFNAPVPPPAGEPNEGEQVCLQFSLEWLPYVLGALTQLTLQSTWKSDDPEIVRLSMRRGASLISQIALSDACAVGEAPYWDDAENADDDDNSDELYPWYEQVADWAISGFVASTLSPTAAIFYQTTVPKARLAFRRGEYGAMVKIFINGLLADTVDTYSALPDVIEYEYELGEYAALSFSAQQAEPHLIKIEHAGEANPAAIMIEGGYRLDVIRKRIDSTIYSEVTIPRPRYWRVFGGKYEVSTDGGETWTIEEPPETELPAPQPRTEPDDEEKKCLAARNAVEVYKQAFTQLIDDATNNVDPYLALGGLSSLAGGLFFPPVLLFLLPIFLAIYAMLNIMQLSDWTESVTDDLSCIFVTHASVGSGGVVHFNYGAITNQLGGKIFEGRIWMFISYMVNMLGEGALDRAGGTTAITEYECCPDEWCYEFNFSSNNGGFAVVTFANHTPNFIGEYDASGWVGTNNASTTGGNSGRYRGVYIYKSFTSSTVTSIEMTYTKVDGTYNINSRRGTIAGRLGATTKFDFPGLLGVSEGNGLHTLLWEGEETLDSITLRVDTAAYRRDDIGAQNGSVTIHSVTLRGKGTNPFGISNCI